MMIAPIFARLSTRRQMMLRKSLVLVVSFTLRATPTAIAAGYPKWRVTAIISLSNQRRSNNRFLTLPTATFSAAR